jgi:LPXTG-motif cell wall-anchored protein
VAATASSTVTANATPAPPTPAPPTPVEPPIGGLPATGNDPNSILTLALDLLTLGALSLLTTRRRALR